MKGTTIIGSILIVVGLLILIFQGFTYKTTEEVAKIGPLEAEVEKERRVPLSPILGGIVLAGGIVLVIVGSKRS